MVRREKILGISALGAETEVGFRGLAIFWPIEEPSLLF